jgi:protoporphyrinogen oxidase
MDRRTFLLGMAASPLLMHCQRSPGHTYSGDLLGPDHVAGHALVKGDFPVFTQTRRSKVVIVGGGISGLSAAWHLQAQGMHDYTLLELEATVGGNARSGRNSISPYPWGAHYLPVPNHENLLLKQLLAETGVIVSGYDDERPQYHERYLCYAPQERLYIHGQWQEGLRPSHGLTRQEHADINAFEQQMQHFRQARGKDGRPAFAIPLNSSSTDAEFLALDKISMSDYLHAQGWHSKPLHWYVNYACRDDYGVPAGQISAWAGIHYFASRRGQAANAEVDQVLTWPQGNGWLAGQLASKQQAHIHTRQLVHAITLEKHGVTLDVLDLHTQQTTRWLAEQVIYASPAHTLPYVLRNATDLAQAARSVQHAPWLVANISLNNANILNANLPAAWDNVLYDSPGLGYVVANHQSLQQQQSQTVITYYHAVTRTDSSSARKQLYTQPWQALSTQITQDLQQAHPHIAQAITRMDIWRWGHAMTSPRPGFLSNKQRLQLNQQTRYPRLSIAHTDAAGISIFEEAFDQGVQAATRCLSATGRSSK